MNCFFQAGQIEHYTTYQWTLCVSFQNDFLVVDCDYDTSHKRYITEVSFYKISHNTRCDLSFFMVVIITYE